MWNLFPEAFMVPETRVVPEIANWALSPEDAEAIDAAFRINATAF